ncbi:MAG: hypothetical protein DME86_07220 [Verrucomicrobia bacterium]|nr:MAG: hypothetical protein DME86_07220 [Verrucomicrobiota bacterium]
MPLWQPIKEFAEVVISAPRRLGFALLLERFDTLTNCLENRLVNFLSRDIAMPEADGGELAARIESDPTSHRTPVVFLTALVTKAEAKSALQIQGHPHSLPSQSAFQT